MGGHPARRAHKICAYALNEKYGTTNPSLGCLTVTVVGGAGETPETVAPPPEETPPSEPEGTSSSETSESTADGRRDARRDHGAVGHVRRAGHVGSAPVRHAVIMAGGSGTRLWPLSRAARPKQLLDVVASPDGGARSLLAEAFARLEHVLPAERIWVCTAARYADAVRTALPGCAPTGWCSSRPPATRPTRWGWPRRSCTTSTPTRSSPW